MKILYKTTNSIHSNVLCQQIQYRMTEDWVHVYASLDSIPLLFGAKIIIFIFVEFFFPIGFVFSCSAVQSFIFGVCHFLYVCVFSLTFIIMLEWKCSFFLWCTALFLQMKLKHNNVLTHAFLKFTFLCALSSLVASLQFQIKSLSDMGMSKRA